MPQPTTIMGEAKNQGQVIVLDSRKQEQVVSDKQYMKILQLSDLLSRHLDIANILQVFSNEIKSLIPHTGYRFVTNDIKEPVRKGKLEPYSLNYHLNIQQSDLGELTLYRNDPFSSNEVCQFEDLLCSLVYPLRNSLMYHSAIASAYKDPLTGINNRAAMDKLLPREVKLAKRHDQRLAMMIMDMDGFKDINDDCGHDVGDHLLQTVAGLIQHSLRDTDMLFRFGGDEFVAALPQTDIQGAIDVGNRILKSLHDQSIPECAEIERVGLSIGISMLHAGDDFKRFFKRADQAMYRAKQTGKNRIVVG